jgi:hypothetical protein
VFDFIAAYFDEVSDSLYKAAASARIAIEARKYSAGAH